MSRRQATEGIRLPGIQYPQGARLMGSGLWRSICEDIGAVEIRQDAPVHPRSVSFVDDRLLVVVAILSEETGELVYAGPLLEPWLRTMSCPTAGGVAHGPMISEAWLGEVLRSSRSSEGT